MLGSTPSGDAYTERQLEEMGRAAGFVRASFPAAAADTPYFRHV